MQCPSCGETIEGDPSFQITGIGICTSCGEIFDIQQLNTDPIILDIEEDEEGR